LVDVGTGLVVGLDGVVGVTWFDVKGGGGALFALGFVLVGGTPKKEDALVTSIFEG